MSKASLDILGGKAVRRMFAIAAVKVSKDLSKEMNASALTIENTAKQLAPRFDGKLSQSIKHNIGEPLTKYVYSELKYAPFIEFGTGHWVFVTKDGDRVDPKYHKFAARFKQSGGSVDHKELLEHFKRYVKKKKLVGTYSEKTGRRTGKKKDRAIQDKQADQLAATIMYFVLSNGIKAQPFLIPAYEMERPKLIKRIQNLLRK
jgi:hypothetical protein